MPGWTTPDKGEGQNDLQSIMFQEYLEILVAGINGIDCVLSGCLVSDGGSPDMTPAVAKGAVLSNGTLFAIAAGTVTIGTADATNPRLDLVVVTSAGALAVRAGTAAENPKPPVRTANDVVLAVVYVPANDTTIANAQITDMRVLRQGPIVVFKETAAKSQNNSVAAVSVFTAAPVIPNGLFLAGRVLRVRMGGNMLHNTTTSWTITVIITFGGTTIFNDTTTGFGVTAEPDRTAWQLEFALIANANNNQRLVGRWWHGPATITPPTTGIGDIGVDEELGEAAIASASGGIAVDADAGDRTIDVTFTMSSANTLHEWVKEYVTVELM